MLKKLKPHQKYKKSGIEWLMEVPEHWVVRRLGFYFHERKEKVSDRLYKPLSVTKKGIVPQLENAAKTDDGDNRKKVCKGDFVINSRSDRKGSSGLSKLTGSVSLINTVLSPQNIDASYTEWLMKSEWFKEEFYRYGKGIVADLWSTNYSEMKNIILPIACHDEQIIIANYLDKQTAKIDQLIENYQKLIVLSKEKRTALITHCVTKGLDPTVKMKDSGVQWLGEMPISWRKSKLGYKSTIKARLGWKGLKAEEYVESGYIFLATPNIKNREIDFENVNYITEERYNESPEIMLKQGDVLVTKDGSTTGTTNIVRTLPAAATVNSSIAVIRPNAELESIYLYYYFTSKYIQEHINMMRGGMGVPHLFQADLVTFHVVLPSYSEQTTIANYLDQQTAKIDQTITKAKQAIELLKEKRTALITAVVTGKVDVRECV
ncbi:MAG: restriction endonuclease subunit S [Proteobacteria bacterium]|nr:restriction endonuclease subunit S [Pseudomonadota bacterium]